MSELNLDELAADILQEIAEVATPESWCLSHSDTYGLCIEKDDDAGRWKYDDDAVDFVAKKAREGSRPHLMAMQIHADSQRDYWCVTLPEILAQARQEGGQL